MNSELSSTDAHWNARALTVRDDASVNMPETVQRDLELPFIFRHLSAGARVVEIGCGNGYVTQQLRERVGHVDAFDRSRAMIERARATYGEKNNRFVQDDLLAPKHTRGPYDAALCVRVLINLANLDEHKAAVRNIANMLRPGGRLILIEGYRDGFEELSRFRQMIGLPAVVPAAHNCYGYLGELLPTINEHFIIDETWHTGLYDFLTRIVYPQLVGAENATTPGEFHAKIAPVVRAAEGPDLSRYARFRGFALARR